MLREDLLHSSVKLPANNDKMIFGVNDATFCFAVKQVYLWTNNCFTVNVKELNDIVTSFN